MTRIKESKRGQRGPALLEAARSLFFKHGYAGTTMDQVAAKAGFSKRTTYLYFKNKDDLFITVAEEGLVILREKLEAIPVEQLSIEDSIAAIKDVYIWFARNHSNHFKIIFQEPTPEMIKNVSRELRKQIEEHERACLGVVSKVAQKAIDAGMIVDVDPWEIAAIFWGAVTGVLLLSMGGSQTVFTRKTREELVEKTTWIIYEGFQKRAFNGS